MSETIINGIDVSECCCFENDRCLWTKRYYENCYVVPYCEAVKNCYFKQFKRLEQEYNELKEKEFKNEGNNFNNYFDSDACLRESNKQGE